MTVMDANKQYNTHKINFRSIPPSQPNKAGLDVCPSTHPQEVSPIRMKFGM